MYSESNAAERDRENRGPKTRLMAYMVAVAIIMVLSLYARARIGASLNAEREGIVKRLVLTSHLASDLVAGEELSRYLSPDDIYRPDYRRLKETLAAMARECGVKYIYYFRIVDGLVQYIVDNDFDHSTRVGLETPPVDPRVELGYEKAMSGHVSTDGTVEYGLGWPDMLSVHAPVFNESGEVVAVVGVDLPESEIKNARVKA
ncbi:MAG: hypothetical protein LBE01_02045, partial [Deltaproteobacteria bacterium]|nr:hypothetical protein [Deltaproteobacteria bacterium]